MTHSERRAFTLLELLGVITIIALLLGLIGGAIAKAHSKAKKMSADTAQGQTNIVQMIDADENPDSRPGQVMPTVGR